MARQTAEAAVAGSNTASQGPREGNLLSGQNHNFERNIMGFKEKSITFTFFVATFG